MSEVEFGRRRVLRAGVAAGSLFLPLPYAWVWAQSEGAVKLLKAPKVALVIGNSRYKDAPELKNPANDAKAIGEMLKGAGFEVSMKLDSGREGMLEAIKAYVHLMEQKKHVGLFYFAGHGLQLAWRNYLLPVDAVIDKIEDVARQSVDLARLMDALTRATNPMNVIILDACRENPFGKDFRVEHKGLSQMDAPQNTLLAYATSPGNVASDGEGANGLYTENLLREIKVPEAKIEDVFKRVRLGVRRKSNGAQIPWESTSLEEDFWFLPPKALKKLSDGERERAFKEELAIWEKAKGSGDPAPIEQYLRRYPTGAFAEIAQLELDRALAKQGERKVQIINAPANPYTKGSAAANAAFSVGDSYTYRELDPYSKAEQRSYSRTVKEIANDEVRFDDGFVLDLLGNILRYPDGRIIKGVTYLPFEYSIGKRWGNDAAAVLPNGTQLRVETEFVVAAREVIQVPSGSFDAFRISGRSFVYGPAGVTEFRVTHWMAPEKVRTFVMREEFRTIRAQQVFGQRTELVSYRQS